MDCKRSSSQEMQRFGAGGRARAALLTGHPLDCSLGAAGPKAELLLFFSAAPFSSYCLLSASTIARHLPLSPHSSFILQLT